MKYVLILLFFLPSFSFAQIQVSDIDYQLPRDDFARKGFMQVGEEEYFIEQGAEGTKVSLVNGDNLEYIHTLTHRPSDSQLNGYSYSYENSNSGLIYEGPILYEIYWNYIYRVNIVTGELVETINMNEYDIRIQSGFHFGENFFYFNALGIDRNGPVRLDRNTGILDTIDFGGITVDAKRYWPSVDSTKLVVLDLESNDRSVQPFQFSKIEFIETHPSDKTTRLIIKDENEIHLLKNDDVIETLSCTIPTGSKLKYVSEKRLAYTVDNGFELVFLVLDLENCSETYSRSYFTGAPFDVHTDEQLIDEYFIFGLSDDWAGNGEFYLYDIEVDEAKYIDIAIDFPLMNSSVRYDNSFYFLSTNHIHYIGFLPELYRLDLESYETERISQHEIFQTYSMTIGESQSDAQLNVFVSVNGSTSLLQVDDGQESLETIEEFDLLQNFGIYFNIYRDIWAEGKYFFSTSNAIFVTENDETTKILDLGPDVLSSSVFKQRGDFLYVLSRLNNDKIYVIKIHIQTLNYNQKFLSEIENLNYKTVATDNAIINLISNYSSQSSAGFYDVVSEQFVSFDELNVPPGTPELVSGNSILYQSTSSDNSRWYIINTVTKQVKLTEIEEKTYPDPYPDGEGGFYLVGWRFGEDVAFTHVDGNGKETRLIEDFNYSVFYGGTRFDGNVKSIAFDAPEEMVIVSVKDGEVRQHSIPDGNRVYYQTFYWHESDEISFTEVYNGENYDTYSFSFDSDPKIITSSGRIDRLIQTIAKETFAILVYQDDQNMLSFERYDYESEDMEQLFELQSVRNSAFDDLPIKISDSHYLLSFNDAIHGLEPWIYNVETDEFQLVKDMKEGFASSKIEDYTISPENGEVYFSAKRNEGDRQLFRLENGINFIEEENDMTVNRLNIAPIPTRDYIFLDKDFENVSILTLDGRFVEKVGTYENGRHISIDHLTDGIYFLQARNAYNQVLIEKFIVHR